MQAWQVSKRSRTGLRFTRNSDEAGIASILLQIVDVGLIGVIFIAPLFFGGRHDLGRGVFVGIVAVTAIAWFIRQAILPNGVWVRTKAYLLALAAIAVVAIQLIPMPIEWLRHLTPRNLDLLPLWNGDGEFVLGQWNTASLAPSETKIALAVLTAYVLLFFIALGRLQSTSDIKKVLRLIAVSATLMAAFGLVQLLASNGYYFWFYEHPFVTTHDVAKGSFTCRNHFAHYLVLGIGPLVAWAAQLIYTGKASTNVNSAKPQYLLIAIYCALILVALATLLSLSRGGAMALVVACVVVSVIYYRNQLLKSSHIYGIAILAMLVMGLLSLYGSEHLSRRLNTLSSGSTDVIDRNEGRRNIWFANVEAIKTGGLLGAGAGAHRQIYPVYLPKSLPIEYTHAENGYLQIPTETGTLGALLLVSGIVMIIGWCSHALKNNNSQDNIILVGAVITGIVASLVHSLVDFVWYVPACMSVTILLLACLLRLSVLSAGDESSEMWLFSHSPLLRWAVAASVIIAACGATWVIVNPSLTALEWDRYLVSSSVSNAQARKDFSKGVIVPRDESEQRLELEDRVSLLEDVVAQNPDSARANLRLASKYIQLFDLLQKHAGNAMSVDQVRDAAIASDFSSATELQQWLRRAFGENSVLLYKAYFHTRTALQLCPLQGEGYLYLANLCFLEGRSTNAIDVYLTQSMQVRPYHGRVLFDVGRQWLLIGKPAEAVELWQRIFQHPGSHQASIIHLLAGQMPAQIFVDAFQPAWNTIPYLWGRYRDYGTEQDKQEVLKAAISAAEIESAKISHENAAAVWCSLAAMQEEVGATADSLQSLLKAYEYSPSYYRGRRKLGQVLFRSNQYESALPHLRWCAFRRPNDRALQQELVESQRHVLARTVGRQGITTR